MAHLIPAILAKNKKDFQTKLRFFERFFDLIQIDAMDNTLVKNSSFFDLSEIVKMKPKAQLEIHFMTANPETVFLPWLRYKNLKRVIVHYESFARRTDELRAIIKLVKAHKKEIGIAINPSTKLDSIKPFVDKVDMVLVMGVNPGWSGQSFKKNSLDKIEKLSKKGVRVGVDGGVNEKNISRLESLGAEFINSASMIIKYKKQPKKIIALKEQLLKL